MNTNVLRGRYSPMEMRIFDVLREQDFVTTESLLRKVYPRKDKEPFNAGIVINRAVITLGEKLKRNRETFRLERRRKPRQRLIETRLVQAGRAKDAAKSRESTKEAAA